MKEKQGNIAAALGISSGHLSDMKSGRREISLKVARKIKSVSGLTFCYVLEEKPTDVFKTLGAILEYRKKDLTKVAK